MKLLLWSAFGALVQAQQVYLTTSGPSADPLCDHVSGFSNMPTATVNTRSFSYTLTETVRTATAAPSQSFSTYGLPYSSVERHFANVKTTSWGNWSPNATATSTSRARSSHKAEPYGQAAFSSMWDQAGISSFSRGSLSTTVSPTPVPTSELILPPPANFQPANCHKFPSDFILGVAGAAAQIEGAIADEGRGPALPDIVEQLIVLAESALSSSSDLASLLPAKSEIANNFVTTENYYLYKQDIERIAAMGVMYYSFSIPWTRILPFALPNTPVNSYGLQHYDDLINFALSKGVQPIVTLFHMDTPLDFFGSQPAAEIFSRAYYGDVNLGFQNATFEDAFVHYGKIVMAHFADRVPIWVTINEPQMGCVSGPSIDHVIKAHARLYHFYKDVLNGTGQVTMKMSAVPGVPQDPRNQSHVEATEHYNLFGFGPFLHPLVLGQDYPDAYKMAIQDYVPLSKKDLAYLKGTMDIVSFDVYSIKTIYPVTDNYAACGHNNDTETNAAYPSCVGTAIQTTEGWLMGDTLGYTTYNTAKYLRTALGWLSSTYGKPIMVSEFGLSSSASAAEDLSVAAIKFDTSRSEFYVAHLDAILNAIRLDGVDVVGALAWAFVDNWEWGTFEHQFGLQYVNRTSLERSYRRSFFDMVDFVESRRAVESN